MILNTLIALILIILNLAFARVIIELFSIKSKFFKAILITPPVGIVSILLSVIGLIVVSTWLILVEKYENQKDEKNKYIL